MKSKALIVGVGDGLSSSLARLLSKSGYDVILASRNTGKLGQLVEETGAQAIQCDGSDPHSVTNLFSQINGRLDVAIYNPSARVRGPLVELDAQEVRKAVDITALGAFFTGQAAARKMLDQEMVEGKRGTILFTGASAGVKGFAQSAAFAMGKFAQRGLSESMSRELHPKGIHVAWVNIDGGIRNDGRPERIDAADNPDSMLNPGEIAKTYMHLIDQDRTSWSNEIAVRPWVERF